MRKSIQLDSGMCRLDNREHKRHIPLKEGTSETKLAVYTFHLTVRRASSML